MPPYRVLLTANNLNIGGPSKMMLGLLENLDPARFDVSIAALAGGGLTDELARRAPVWLAPPTLAALQVRKSQLMRDLRALVLGRHPAAAAELVAAPFQALKGASMTVARQRMWRNAENWVRRLRVPGEYDLALSLASGSSRYMTIDCVDASRKAMWIMSDYSALRSDDRIEAAYVRRYDTVLTISRLCQRALEDAIGPLPGEVGLLPPVIPWDFYEEVSEPATELESARRPALLTVARLERGKGLQLAVEAAAALERRGFAFDWFILGEGSERAALEASVSGLRLDDRVHFLGFRRNVPDYLSACDMVVHPSLSEGRSVAVDEALALGKWVIATQYPTVYEQIEPGINGDVAGFSGEELADVIIGSAGRTGSPISRLEQRRETDAIFERLAG